ncbi:MAG: sugar phosphate isomerase/epimerase family protein [Phycisphaeraceae bacterium]
MKYAFMTFSCPTATFEQMLTLAKQLGYAGVEPRIVAKHAHGVETTTPPDQRKIMRKTAEKLNVAICCIATSCRFAVAESQQATIADALAAIDLAGDLDCHRIRVFGGDFPASIPRSSAIATAVEGLKRVADHAAKRDVVVCMETHDSWSNPVYVAEVMRTVNHPNIAVNYDMMHPVRAGGSSNDEAYAMLRPWVRHVHIHDGLRTVDQLVMLPLGTGELDPRGFLRLLRADNYAGYVSGEWIDSTMSPDFWKDHLKTEMRILQRYDREG